MNENLDRDIHDELQFHLDELISRIESRGLSRAEAEREAAARFGDPDQYRAALLAIHRPERGATPSGPFTALRNDLRYALRTMLRAPGFTAVVVVTLALGIGASTAIFSVIRGVLLRPLALAEPDRLVAVWDTNPSLGVTTSPTSVDTYFRWKDEATTFTSLASWAFGSVTLEAPEGAVELTAVLGSGNYLSTLGVSPFLGRVLDESDEVPGRQGSVTMLSHRVWQDRFGADAAVLGTTIQLDGNPTEIVGVMPPNHLAPNDNADLWLPMGYQPRAAPNHGVRNLMVVGRLAPGVRADQAREQIAAISDRIAVDQPASARDWSGTVMTLRDYIVGPVESSLALAFGAVVLLLVIACINVANVLLARSASREGEIALRCALGAGRTRISCQLLTESVLLAAVGGTAGLGVAFGLHRLLLALEPGILPRLGEVRLDSMVLAFGFGVALLTGVLFGLAPVANAVGIEVATALRPGGGGASATLRQNRARRALVVGQVALTLMLLTGAGLLTRTFLALRSVDPGFRAEGVVAARMFLDPRRYGTQERVNLYYRTLLDRIRELAGVTAAGATSSLPMDPVALNYDLPFRTEGTAGVPVGDLPQADYRVVSAGYFETMAIGLISGRALGEVDDGNSPQVILVNRTMAERNWPGENPVGRRVETLSPGWTWFEIVGVVEDTRYYGLDREPRPEMYVAQPQRHFGALTVVARTTGDLAALTTAIVGAIREVDPQMPANSILPVTDLIADSIAAERFYAALLGAFAIVAMALAAAGLYGVLSYWVHQRRREIGVRMALGAPRGEVIAMVVRNGMQVTLAGIVMGIAGSWVTSRVLSDMLFGVRPFDPATLVIGSTLLAATAMVACYVPAFRAGRTDPLHVLRAE